MTTLRKGQYVRIQTEEPDSALNGTWGIIDGFYFEQAGKRYRSVMVRVQGQIEALPFDRTDLTPITKAETDALANR